MQRHIVAAAACATFLAAGSAHAALNVGPLDQATGLQWAIADSVTEAQSSGYRAASTSEFIQMLSDGQMSVNAAQGLASLPWMGGRLGELCSKALSN